MLQIVICTEKTNSSKQSLKLLNPWKLVLVNNSFLFLSRCLLLEIKFVLMFVIKYRQRKWGENFSSFYWRKKILSQLLLCLCVTLSCYESHFREEMTKISVLSLINSWIPISLKGYRFILNSLTHTTLIFILSNSISNANEFCFLKIILFSVQIWNLTVIIKGTQLKHDLFKSVFYSLFSTSSYFRR